MTQDISEKIDEMCLELYGHKNWGYLDTFSKKELEENPHDVEGKIVFFYNDKKDEEKE